MSRKPRLAAFGLVLVVLAAAWVPIAWFWFLDGAFWGSGLLIHASPDASLAVEQGTLRTLNAGAVTVMDHGPWLMVAFAAPFALVVGIAALACVARLRSAGGQPVPD